MLWGVWRARHYARVYFLLDVWHCQCRFADHFPSSINVLPRLECGGLHTGRDLLPARINNIVDIVFLCYKVGDPLSSRAVSSWLCGSPNLTGTGARYCGVCFPTSTQEMGSVEKRIEKLAATSAPISFSQVSLSYDLLSF